MAHATILPHESRQSNRGFGAPGSLADVESLRVRIVGTGKAGTAVARALRDSGCVDVEPSLRHGDDLTRAAVGVDIVILAVPDAAIAGVAAQMAAVPETVVAHLSGATALDALLPHERRASLHPLVPMSDPVNAAEALKGAWMAAAGDPLIERLAGALNARLVRIDESDRAIHHAAAVVASNHLIALLGQVERISKPLGVPIDAYLDLAAAALESTRRLGPARALPGPVSRGDWQTIRAHINAIAPSERSAYIAMAKQAAVLAGREWPANIT